MDFSEKEKPKKIYDKKSAFLKAQQYCAYQERSQQEVRNKLYDWGLHKEDVENVIIDLITEGFLNEERFAIAFAGGKFRIKKWGKVKIRLELKKHKISTYCINKALTSIDSDEYIKSLKEIIEKKAKSITEKNMFKKNYKIATYAISKGFENELVKEILAEISEQ